MLKLLRYGVSGAALAVLFSATAFAGVETESYVDQNANNVLAALNDPELEGEARRAKFNAYMDEFADIDRISNFVIGKYSRRFSETEMEAYRDAFRTYALAVYESQLDQYRGNRIVVTGSTDFASSKYKYSDVDSEILLPDGDVMEATWRLLIDGETIDVVDVALNLEGNEFWLAQEQRAQFIALLDQTNGSAEKLIARLNEMTEKLETERTPAFPDSKLAQAENASGTQE